MWSFPGPGIEPVSSALADGLLSAAAPGKSFRFGTEFTFYARLSLPSASIAPRQNMYLKTVSTLLYLIGDPKGPSTSAPFAFIILNSDLISASWEFPFCPPFLPSAFSVFPRFCLHFPSYVLSSVAFFFSISVSYRRGVFLGFLQVTRSPPTCPP